MASQKLIVFQRVVGICILSLLLLSAIAFGANRPVWWSLLAIGILVLSLFQILSSLLQPAPKQLGSLLVPAILFLGVIVWGWLQTTSLLPPNLAHPLWDLVPDASKSVSADPGQGRHAVMRLLTYALIFCAILLACVDRLSAVVMMMIIALFSTALAGLGIFFMVTGTNPILGDLADPRIVKATFVNRNNYATYAGFGLLANLAVATHLSDQRSNTIRDKIEGFFANVWIFALGFAVCMTAIALTQSRAGVMACGVGLLIFLAVRYSNGRWRGSVTLLLIAAIVGFVLLTSSNGLMRSYMLTGAEESRFIIFPAVVDAIMDRPLLGHGLGSFEDVFRAYVPESASEVEYLRAHNTYLELAFGLGLPALVALLLGFVWVTIRIMLGAIKRRSDRMLPCFALGCIAIATAHSFLDFSLQIPAVAALFAAILGLGYAQSNYDKPPKGRPINLTLEPEDPIARVEDPIARVPESQN